MDAGEMCLRASRESIGIRFRLADSGPDPALARAMRDEVSGAVGVSGAYDPPRGEEDAGRLTVEGVHGKVDWLVGTFDAFLEYVEERARKRDGRRIVAEKTISSDVGEMMTCRLLEADRPGPDKVSVWRSCAWADAGAVAQVTWGVPPSEASDVDEWDLEAFAAETADVRDAVQQDAEP
ncbi:hypothetical protein RCO28_17145 [Streptomyces sp. LHD-70]|uniref:hypothetical protein n=1 Tax=Streptomyces sp. LHD-70 TaxID=3072140 RepID=UPI00280F6B5F|nr:hypothetical protein [Streptomyces sp. LHD-70]MDQ8704200.1 hypothetical protein [Streptomyces sp. LHD-70]